MRSVFGLALVLLFSSACVAGTCHTQTCTGKEMLFKILTPQEWDQFQRDKVYKGSALDLKSGFIHIAFEDQYPQILEKFFKKDERPLILVKVDPKLLKPGTLKIEPNKPGGDKFPHIYGEIPFKAVMSHKILDK